MISISESATRLMVRGNETDISAIRQYFSYHPNGYYHADRYQIFLMTEGKEGWDGYRYAFEKLGHTAGTMLRGRLEELLRFCHREGIQIDEEKSKFLPKPLKALALQDVSPDCIIGEHELDERQCRMIHQWLTHGYGVGHMAVNAGKTLTFAGAAAMVKRSYPKARILYITFTERLVAQAYKEFKSYLPDLDITQFGGGKSDRTGKDMVVCTVAMLNKHFRKLLFERWFQTFMVIEYDEVHHCGSETSEKILGSIPAYFRFGASGSRKEEDPAKNAAILGWFGPVRNVVKQATLIDEGRSAKPHIYVVDVRDWNNRYKHLPYNVEENTPAWALVEGVWRKGTYLGPVIKTDAEGNAVMRKRRMVDFAAEEAKVVTVEEEAIESGLHRVMLEGAEEESHIESKWCLLNRVYDKGVIRFRERNNLVVDWAKYFSGQGHPTVVVCTRTLHIHILHSLITAAIDPELVRTLYGADSTGKRNNTFDWFKETPGSVLITPLIQEGVSINEIRAGVVADYVSDWERADQIVGRFIRKKKERNWAELVWIVDRQHGAMRRGCVRMLDRLQKVEGYEFYYGINTPDMIPAVQETLL